MGHRIASDLTAAGVPRQNALARALQEHGRIAKTLHVRRYLDDDDSRRRINRQLNRGESLHVLRRFLFFAHEGHVRRRRPDDQADQTACLTLLTNAIVVWNTVYMAATVEQLAAEGLIDPPSRTPPGCPEDDDSDVDFGSVAVGTPFLFR